MRVPILAALSTLRGQRRNRGGQDAEEGSRTRSRLVRRFGILALAFVLFGGFVLSATLVTQRSFLLQGVTSSLTIRFAGLETGWLFPEAIVCRPLEQPNPRGEDLPDQVCPSTIYSEEAVSDLEFGWRQDEEVLITTDTDGTLRIERIAGSDPDYPAGTIVVLDQQQWRRNGALAFEGVIELGEDIASGARHYLMSGRWEARQTSFATGLLRSITDVVKVGELARGTQAGVFIGGSPANMTGHITPSFDLPEGFDFVLISEPGRTELRLELYGFDEPLVLRPDWIDTAVTSPLFLAAIVLLTLLALMTQIYGDLSAMPRKGGGSGDAPGEEAKNRQAD